MDYRPQYYDSGAAYMVPPAQQQSAGYGRPSAHHHHHSSASHGAPTAGPSTPLPPPIRKDPDPSLAHLPSQDRAYYYSSSDDDSERSDAEVTESPGYTNRGRKLKRGARDVRRGRLGGWPKFGPDAYPGHASKRARIDLTPSLSLAPRGRRDGASGNGRQSLKLPPPPKNPVDLMTSPSILRTFAAPSSHLPTLALSAVTLIEADAALLRVLSRICDVLRGDRVPFVGERVKEVKEERKRAIEERKRLAEEEAQRVPPPPPVQPSPSPEPEAEPVVEEEEEEEVEPPVEEEQAVEADVGEKAEEEAKPTVTETDDAVREGDAMAEDIPVVVPNVEESTQTMDVDIPVPALPAPEADIEADGEGDVNADDEAAANLLNAATAAPDEPTRSSSPASDWNARRRSGRRAAAKATAANANLSRERSPTPELANEDSDAGLSDDAGPGLQPAPLAGGGTRSNEVMLELQQDLMEGAHLPPSLRRLANPETYVRSLFVTEGGVSFPNGGGGANAEETTVIDAEAQVEVVATAMQELNRFFADTVEYRERLGEIRDGTLGVERRRKGLHAILKILSTDALDYDF